MLLNGLFWYYLKIHFSFLPLAQSPWEQTLDKCPHHLTMLGADEFPWVSFERQIRPHEPMAGL